MPIASPIMLPPNAVVSKLVDQQVPLPPNIANQLDPKVQVEIMRDMYDNYVFPQVLERQQYEPIWDNLLDMYRIKIKEQKLKFNVDDQEKRERLMEIQAKDGNADLAQVSDSLVFDAVDRLKNLNHFISWKDGTPIQFNISPNFSSSKENTFYHPLANKIKSANGLLKWNIDNQDVYRKHLIVAQHHYLYGCSFVASELEMESRTFPRRTAQGFSQITELYRAGVTFEPVSIRKLWLNYRMSAYDMDSQPCPFIFEEMPRFSVMANQYNPQTNPFGYVNLDKLPAAEWLLQQQEMESFRDAIYSRLQIRSGTELLDPKYSVEGRWTFYPMLQLDPATMEYKTRKDGRTPIPFKRFIVQWFGTNLRQGQMFPIRIQENFYPMNRIPLYSSQHIPDQDSGAYSPSLGELLTGHYEQVCTCMNQWIDNKNLINNPPSWHLTGSPSATQDCNRPGARLNTLGANDFGWRTVPDATQSTVAMLEYLRDKAKTTSKATEAILGQAMGSRTTATEASNVFQAAMSGVTTDINLFNYDIMGGYANRVWEITGLFFDPDLIKAITGMYGEPLTPEDLNTRVQLTWDIGSTYIESITKQQHLRYALESAVNSPVLRQDILWRLMFKELKMPHLEQAIVDGGFSEQVQLATEQAIETYQGKPVMIDPSQDHQAALEVKSRFIKDLESRWNTEFGALPDLSGTMTRVQNLARQCQLHQQFIMIQMQQQMALQQQQMAAESELKMAGKRDSQSGPVSRKGGDVAQQNGRALS